MSAQVTVVLHERNGYKVKTVQKSIMVVFLGLGL
jgi:hypothetical protein